MALLTIPPAKLLVRELFVTEREGIAPENGTKVMTTTLEFVFVSG
jgi:hypothetical protein